jgi:hypothetical protein
VDRGCQRKRVDGGLRPPTADAVPKPLLLQLLLAVDHPGIHASLRAEVHGGGGITIGKVDDLRLSHGDRESRRKHGSQERKTLVPLKKWSKFVVHNCPEVVFSRTWLIYSRRSNLVKKFFALFALFFGLERLRPD